MNQAKKEHSQIEHNSVINSIEKFDQNNQI